MLDILIVNGQVMDGTGSAGIYAAVGVQGDTVSIHRGDSLSLEAAKVIDATGCVVCPGFIDIQHIVDTEYGLNPFGPVI